MTSSIKVTPTTATLGAEVSGIDLANPSPEDINSINSALLDHGVLFFRGQMLTDEEHANFASQFGTIARYPVQDVLGVKDQAPVSYIKDTPDSPPKADGWHTDLTWLEVPPKMAFLQPTELPETGGDTMWGCLYEAYDKLSPVMREFCNGLTVKHVIGDVILKQIALMGEGIVDKLIEAYPPVIHPLVRTHPEIGRSALFYAGGFMGEICELTEAESRMFLDFLESHINDHNIHIRWSWELGDLAMWDERRTIHRALSNHYPRERTVRRCTVDGDRPFYKAN